MIIRCDRCGKRCYSACADTRVANEVGRANNDGRHGVGMDGKPAKWKSVSEMPDDDTVNMSMFVGDAKEPMFTITYKRKK